MRKPWIKYIAIATISATLLTGCKGSTSSNITTSNTSTSSSTTSSTTSATATSTTTNESTSTVVVDKEFSAKDLEVGYDESSSTNITLNGNTIKSSSSNGVTIKDSTLTITKKGTYVISGTLKDGQIIVDTDDKSKVHIVLNGVNITCSDNAPIYVKSADKVFITLAKNSTNTLTDGATYTQSDDTNVDGVIFSKSDLTLNGSGTLTITGNYKHGIASKDDLIITGGTYHITAVKDGLNGKDCVKIKDGTFDISVTDGNGIQSKNGDDTTKGYVYICGGKINITKCQEGIEGTAILVEDGTIDIVAKDDGMNAASGSSSSDTTSNGSGSNDANISNSGNSNDNTNGSSNDNSASNTIDNTSTVTTTTSSSNSSTKSKDSSTTTDSANTNDSSTTTNRGFDKADKGSFGGMGKGGGAMENDTNCYIAISDGTVKIDASGDGIDSNGSVTISGGSVYVNGPTSGGDAGLDYNGAAKITKGTVVIAGSVGMAQGFSDSSSQYSILYNFSSVNKAGTKIKVTDSDGNVVLSYTPTKDYQSVVISSPDLKKNGKYKITCGSQSAEVTLSSIVTSGGEQSTMGGHGGMGGGPGIKGGPGMKGGPGANDSSDGNQPPQFPDNSTNSTDSNNSNETNNSSDANNSSDSNNSSDANNSSDSSGSN